MKRWILRIAASALFLLGAYLVVMGVQGYVSSRSYPNADDLKIAETPLLRVPLKDLAKDRVTVLRVKIPDSEQWRKIRRSWGPQEYVLGFLVAYQKLACLDDWGIRIDISESARTLPTRSGHVYAYTQLCPVAARVFDAAPGADVKITLTVPDPAGLPEGDLVVLSEWFNMKDKIVGVGVAQDFRWFPLCIAAVGLVFAMAGRFLWRLQ